MVCWALQKHISSKPRSLDSEERLGRDSTADLEQSGCCHCPMQQLYKAQLVWVISTAKALLLTETSRTYMAVTT
jgi:hypothetical protein